MLLDGRSNYIHTIWQALKNKAYFAVFGPHDFDAFQLEYPFSQYCAVFTFALRLNTLDCAVLQAVT